MWIALILWSLAAYADDCSTVDMTAKGGSMENVSPADQTGQNCYAYAAAYMTSAYIQANSGFKKHQTFGDAIWADVLSGDSTVEDANSGRACNAINVVRRNG